MLFVIAPIAIVFWQIAIVICQNTIIKGQIATAIAPFKIVNVQIYKSIAPLTKEEVQMSLIIASFVVKITTIIKEKVAFISVDLSIKRREIIYPQAV